MPKYFVETLEGSVVGRDRQGVNLPDDFTAKRMAWGSLSDLISDMAGKIGGPLAVKVTDAEGRVVYEVTAAGTSR